MIIVYNSLWKVYSVLLGIFIFLIKFSNGIPIYIHDGRHNLTGEEYDPEDAIFTQPLAIQDGQSITEKIRVMQALAGIERRMEELHGLREPDQEGFINPGNYVYEMDIILTPKQAETIYEHEQLRQKRKMSSSVTSLWEMPIYYYFGDHHSPQLQETIESVIDYWESLTCINFTRASGPVTWEQGNRNNVTIEFAQTDGCWSYVGKKDNANNVQKVSVDRCYYKGSIAHELGHVIGFWHENARPDRNDHVEVMAHHILDNKLGDFVKLSWEEIVDKGVSYDVGSLMHYGSMAFSKSGKPTVVAKKHNLQRALGQRHGLSFYDVKLANLIYCAEVCSGVQLTQPCQNGGYQDPKKCTTCRCPEGLSGDFCETAESSVGLSCGGNINVTNQPTTIEHLEGFRNGHQCNWYITAPVGMNVYLDLVGDFVNFDTCFKDMYVTCDSYLEVRYSVDLANTGARYCCSLKDEPGPLISEGRDMVVLLRGHNNGSIGFKANIWAGDIMTGATCGAGDAHSSGTPDLAFGFCEEPCGGCSLPNSTSYPLSNRPCFQTVTQTCRKTWKQKVRVECKTRWFSPRASTNCNKYVEMSREEACSVTVPTCCVGYHLEAGQCMLSSPPTVKDDDVAGPAGQDQGASAHGNANDDGNDTVSDGTESSGWSTWSACSHTCGGCGTRSRHKPCTSTEPCGDDNDELEMCAETPCPTAVMTTCTRLVAVKAYCPPWSTNTCTKYRSETYTCPDPEKQCCNGYEMHGGVCVLINS